MIGDKRGDMLPVRVIEWGILGDLAEHPGWKSPQLGSNDLDPLHHRPRGGRRRRILLTRNCLPRSGDEEGLYVYLSAQPGRGQKVKFNDWIATIASLLLCHWLALYMV